MSDAKEPDADVQFARLKAGGALRHVHADGLKQIIGILAGVDRLGAAAPEKVKLISKVFVAIAENGHVSPPRINSDDVGVIMMALMAYGGRMQNRFGASRESGYEAEKAMVESIRTHFVKRGFQVDF